MSGTHDSPVARTLHAHQGHLGWNRAFPPVVTVAPGDVIEFHPLDASGGQLTPTSTLADLAALDFTRVNPVVGPVYVDGAEPGDALQVTLLSFAPSGFGWTANIPGFGLLADQFREPRLHLWTYAPDLRTPALYGPGGRVPLKPFCGTLGVAPAEPGLHSVVPPRRVGGNLDIRDLAAGADAAAAGRGARVRCSRSATRTRRRATARCAALPSRVPCRSPFGSTS